MASSSNANNLTLKSLVDKVKLNGTNYLDWDRSLRIVLMYERKEYVLDKAIPADPAPIASRVIKDTHEKYVNDASHVGCIMLSCMESDLQEQFMEMTHDPYVVLGQIKVIYKEKARIARYNVLNELLFFKMSAGDSISPHVLKMKGHLEHLNRLGLKMEKEMAADIVLRSLPRAYS